MCEISSECLFSAQAQVVVGTASGRTKKTAASTSYSASKASGPSAADSSDRRSAASSEKKLSPSGARRSDSETVRASKFKSGLSGKSSSGSIIKGSALSNPSSDSASSAASFELSGGFSESELRSVSRSERLAARRGRESRLVDGYDETERGRTRYSERDSMDSYVSNSLTERHELISENMDASVSETLISSAERERIRGSDMVAVRERERRSERDVSGIGQERMRERCRSL